MEDYKQKYNEALEKAKTLYCQGITDREKENLESIFPELKESEDERIRKELIAHLNEQIDCFISAPDYRDEYEEAEVEEYKRWIAWLEKQKEHVPSTEEQELNALAYLEQLGYTCIPEGGKKPAEWSIEDEKMRADAILYLKNAKDVCASACSPYITKCIKWLKSLNPQPRKIADWSAEDKELQRAIIDNLCILKKMYPQEDMQTDYNRMIEWLKHLRPQSHWKPNKVQIEALLAAICTLKYELKETHDIATLDSLYNDLKALTK